MIWAALAIAVAGLLAWVDERRGLRLVARFERWLDS